MNKYLIFILISSIIIFVSCAPEEANVEIKAGVVMKSGDVKNVPRQEFLITKNNLIEKWNVSKKKYWKGLILIENEIKTEMDFNKKIINLENEINKYRKLITKKTSPNSPEVRKIWHELHVFLYGGGMTATMLPLAAGTSQDVAHKLSQIFKDFHNEYKYETSYEKAKECMKGCKYIWEKLIERSIPKEKEVWEKRDLKKIDVLIISLEAKLRTVRTTIRKKTNEMNDFKEELVSRTNEQFELYKNKAISDFQINLKENIVKSLKTNLNGEALFKIKKGQYFLFAIAQMGQSNLIWNLPVNIEEKEHYIEISNDNAFAIDDATLASELLEAFKVNFNIDKEF